jgi:Fur family ferric uptake transcriptional regulator
VVIMTRTSPELERRLRESGYRLTRPRQAVLAVVALGEEHLNPAQIYERARAIYPKLGIVTVYRTLEVLAELGLIQRVHLDGDCHSYVRADRGHSHQIICRECGRVEAFADCALDPLLSTLRKRTGYLIESHWLELLGRCPNCQ